MKLVMLVEDEYGSAEVTQMLLESEGYRVTAAANGTAALELLSGEKPAVIFSDFMMPHMTGGELGAAVRAQPNLADIPFVIVSGTSEEVVRSSFSDYDAFVPKPFTAAVILELTAHFVANGRGPTDTHAEAARAVRQLLRSLRYTP
jgi:CheY-like chemotaxis protein